MLSSDGGHFWERIRLAQNDHLLLVWYVTLQISLHDVSLHSPTLSNRKKEKLEDGRKITYSINHIRHHTLHLIRLHIHPMQLQCQPECLYRDPRRFITRHPCLLEQRPQTALPRSLHHQPYWHAHQPDLGPFETTVILFDVPIFDRIYEWREDKF